MRVPNTQKSHPLARIGQAIVSAASGRGGSMPAAQDPTGLVSTTASFMRGNMMPVMARWIPFLRDTQDDVRQNWNLATARATDVIQNSGWVSGGIRSAIGNIMGPGLRLVASPDTTLVKFTGIHADNGEAIDADGWARFVERRWEAYCNSPRECDALARMTVHKMARAALQGFFATGEITALLPYHKDETAVTGPKVLLLPPWKLSNKDDPRNRVVQGVEMDTRGRPYAYWFRQKDRVSGVESDVSVRAYDDLGRPQVIHLFEGLAGQVRGITPLVVVLQVVKQYDQLANATLTAAMIQALFAATIESDMPTADVMGALQTETDQGVGGNLTDFLGARGAWASQTSIDLSEQSRVAHLFPGEKLKFNRSEHPNSTYEAFVKVLLRELAKGLGTTAEQVTGDYSGVTYTGVRMGTTDTWNTTLDRRQNLAAPFYQAIYEAWLEDEIETGRIKFPGGIQGFMANRFAAARAKWRGPPKPQADDLKSQKAHQGYREMGVVSDTMICDDLGVTVDEVYEQRSREAKLRAKFGLTDVGPSTQVAVAQTAADAAEEEEMLRDEPEPNEAA